MRRKKSWPHCNRRPVSRFAVVLGNVLTLSRYFAVQHTCAQTANPGACRCAPRIGGVTIEQVPVTSPQDRAAQWRVRGESTTPLEVLSCFP